MSFVRNLWLLVCIAVAGFTLTACQVDQDDDDDRPPDVNITTPPASSPDVNVTTPPPASPDVNITTPPPEPAPQGDVTIERETDVDGEDKTESITIDRD